MYAFERHEVLPLSPSWMEKNSTRGVGRVPRAALRHGTHREADLSLWHWPGAERLISFRLKRLFAAKTSLPKDNFIILIIRCPVMIKCLLLASVWRVSCWQAAYYGRPFVLRKSRAFYWKVAKKSYLSLEVEKVQLINLFLSLTSRHNRFYSTAIYCNYRIEQAYTVACSWVSNEEWKIDVQRGQMTNTLVTTELVEQE